MQRRFGLRRLEGQLDNLGGHVLGIELVHRVAGQSHGRNPGHGMPVPVDDRIQMIEDRIAAQALLELCASIGGDAWRSATAMANSKETPACGLMNMSLSTRIFLVLPFHCTEHWSVQYSPFDRRETCPSASSLS